MLATRPSPVRRSWPLLAALAVGAAALVLWLTLGPESLVAGLSTTLAALFTRDGVEASTGLMAVAAASAGLAARRAPDLSPAVARPVALANAVATGEPLNNPGDTTASPERVAPDTAPFVADDTAPAPMLAAADNPLMERPDSSAPTRGPPSRC